MLSSPRLWVVECCRRPVSFPLLFRSCTRFSQRPHNTPPSCCCCLFYQPGGGRGRRSHGRLLGAEKVVGGRSRRRRRRRDVPGPAPHQRGRGIVHGLCRCRDVFGREAGEWAGSKHEDEGERRRRRRRRRIKWHGDEKLAVLLLLLLLLLLLFGMVWREGCWSNALARSANGSGRLFPV